MMWLLTNRYGRALSAFVVILALFFGGAAVFRIWLAAHDRNVLHGYVLESRAITAEAERDEYKRQAEANKIVADAYQVQYRNQLRQEELEDALAEKERQANAAANLDKGRDDSLNDDDIRFLQRRP